MEVIMKNAKKTITIVFVVVFAVFLITTLSKKANKNKDPYESLFKTFPEKKIDVDSLMNQTTKHRYYVYVYRPDCPDCQALEKTVNDAVQYKSSLYFMNENENLNDINKFDWKAFNTQNDREIGKVVNGKIVYNKGESVSHYLKTTKKDPYGYKIVYKIQKYTKEYAKYNTNAKPGKVYASVNRPWIDYSQYKKGKLTLGGVPTLLEINKKKIVHFYYGNKEIKTVMKQWKEENM